MHRNDIELNRIGIVSWAKTYVSCVNLHVSTQSAMRFHRNAINWASAGVGDKKKQVKHCHRTFSTVLFKLYTCSRPKTILNVLPYTMYKYILYMCLVMCTHFEQPSNIEWAKCHKESTRHNTTRHDKTPQTKAKRF